MRAPLVAFGGVFAALAPLPAGAQATPAPPTGPCAGAVAAALADRPGTGRATSTGGSPCVVLPGELLVETGLRRQRAVNGAGGENVLSSGPLTVLRYGIAPRVEVVVGPPAPQARSASGAAPFDAARGVTDLVVGTKVLVVDRPALQASIGASYAPPTGTGEFTAGLPTYTLGINVGIVLTPQLALTVDQAVATAVGTFADGRNRTYPVYAPSYSLAYAMGSNDTLLLQDALVSRQGPLLPSGSRAILGLQHAVSPRFAVDVELERNLAPLNGAQSAVGGGVVWVVRAPR